MSESMTPYFLFSGFGFAHSSLKCITLAPDIYSKKHTAKLPQLSKTNLDKNGHNGSFSDKTIHQQLLL